MTRRNRRRVAGVICLVIMIPLLLPLAISFLAQGIVNFIDWIMEGRWFATTLIGLCDRVYKKLVPEEFDD